MFGRLFITGDIHGDIDIEKLSGSSWREGKRLGHEDILAICGDFGLVWTDPPQRRDEWWLKWLVKKPWTTVFVDGNHENFDVLDAMTIEQWHGGDAHIIRCDDNGSPKVIHLMRGQLFDLNGWKTLALGGAQSHDIEYRLPRISWWEQEMPTPDEIAVAKANLDKNGWAVDLVLTHCAPSDCQAELDMGFEPDRFTDDLQSIADQLDYKLWAFGHYHTDHAMGNNLCSYYTIWEILREPKSDIENDYIELPSGIYLLRSN